MESPDTNSAFPLTQWTAIGRLQASEDTLGASHALAELCEKYWQPLYCFARKLGHGMHDAEDLTQGFFCHILDKDLFTGANPELGRLRTFLLTTFRRYIEDVKERQHAIKRGGGVEMLSLDVKTGEKWYAREPSDSATPESVFDRNWALSLLRSAFEELSSTEEMSGRGEQFKALGQFLSIDGDGEVTYHAVSQSLKMSEEAVRQAVHRLRIKFRDCLRRQIAQTLVQATEQQIDSELRFLREALH